MLQILVVALVAASGSAMAQTVYRCNGPDGQAIFSQQACPDGSMGSKQAVRNDPPSGNSDYIPWGNTLASPPPRERAPQRVNVVGGDHQCSDLSSYEIRKATVQKRALIGMTTEQMIKALGPPLKINGGSSGHRQWVYPGHLYIYTEGGCVVSWN